MNKTVLHAAILALIAPFYAYGLGLGQMTVKSALDQPFSAEIELEDVGNVPIKAIKVSVADPENFTQIGLERAAVLSLLSFTIAKNEQGKAVIKVQSEERMSDPYMELVVDLAWPQGQLYKAYTILLDPPGYHLTSTTIQGSSSHYVNHNQHASEPGVIEQTVVTSISHNPVPTNDNKQSSTYGPTVANESVWQIAQHYKTTDTILPQVVLAIVGANPNAFQNGNLNGLKVGARLTIPATAEIKQVPADLATSEAMAHDNAWNDKTLIDHILTPPYTGGQSAEKTTQYTPSTTSATASVIAPMPALSTTPSSIPQLIPTNLTSPLTANPQTLQNPIPKSVEQGSSSKAEVSITIAALESVRESNALLKEQLHLLQKQNDTMQKQLDERNKELTNLRSQIHVLLKQRQGLASQASASEYHDDSLSLWPFVLLLLVAGGGGFAYWYLRMRPQKGTSEPVKEAVTPKTSIAPASFIVPRDNEESVSADKASSNDLVQLGLPPEHTKAELTEEKNVDKSDEILNAPVTTAVEKAAQLQTDSESPVVDKGVELLIAEQVIAEEQHKAEQEAKEQEAPLEFAAPKEEPPVAVDDTTGAIEQEPNPEPAEDELLQFESGLHKSLKAPEKAPESKEEKEEADDGIDFVFSFDEPTVESDIASKEEKYLDVDDELKRFFVENDAAAEKPEPSSVVEEQAAAPELAKSEAALGTLLALAKTYLSMNDFESARHSLIEVIEHGNQNQKDEATCLLESIKNK